MRSNSKTRWAIIERKKSSDADFLLQGCWDKRSLYRKTSDSNALLFSWFCFIFRALNQQAAQCRNMSVGKLCEFLSWHLLRENQGAWVAQHFVKRSNMWLCCCTRKDSNKSRWLVLRQSARLWEAELAKDRASLTTPLLLAAESMAHSLSHLCKSLTCPGLSGASHLFSEIYMYCICMSCIGILILCIATLPHLHDFDPSPCDLFRDRLLLGLGDNHRVTAFMNFKNKTCLPSPVVRAVGRVPTLVPAFRTKAYFGKSGMLATLDTSSRQVVRQTSLCPLERSSCKSQELSGETAKGKKDSEQELEGLICQDP